jgi:hypothetical protein
VLLPATCSGGTTNLLGVVDPSPPMWLYGTLGWKLCPGSSGLMAAAVATFAASIRLHIHMDAQVVSWMVSTAIVFNYSDVLQDPWLQTLLHFLFRNLSSVMPLKLCDNVNDVCGDAEAGSFFHSLKKHPWLHHVTMKKKSTQTSCVSFLVQQQLDASHVSAPPDKWFDDLSERTVAWLQQPYVAWRIRRAKYQDAE